ncbi:hypothetical protein BHE74_00043661 [Ensete ventricosum]|nr:hypothetical protein BHE74_00043661 [Ensete ventricosum]
MGGSVGHTARESPLAPMSLTGFIYASHQQQKGRTYAEVAVMERQVRLLSVFSPAFGSMDVSIRILLLSPLAVDLQRHTNHPSASPCGRSGPSHPLPPHPPPSINLEPPTHETRERESESSLMRRGICWLGSSGVLR